MARLINHRTFLSLDISFLVFGHFRATLCSLSSNDGHDTLILDLHLLRRSIMSPGTKLVALLCTLCDQHGLPWDDQLSNDLPRKWRVHGDMLLLPSSRCFLDH